MIFTTQDGSHSIQSEKYGVSYHSKYGAIQETQHVFIDAALNYKSSNQKQLSVLEIGFGTGLNALMTWLEAKKQDLEVDYHTFEAFPISLEQANALNYPIELKTEPSQFLQLHTCDWEIQNKFSSNFSFTKYQRDFHEIDFSNQFDVIYFDAFAPNAQANLWEMPLLQKMFDALKKEGVLTTYCAKGVVKRCLKSIGFTIEAISGPPGKREMTRALKR